ncbi:helix-turn-helix transcriptional regulator [Arhodomonas aquaeolei]|uniref:helix-turn-helix transcriptional regulator n=1 Tax=Arhodomonas aquaeolei TaxID=2369 RepID=UPI0012EC15FB|nr:helix-turn-helix transcriptional regulator [Arhodomonas aquaeolei]
MATLTDRDDRMGATAFRAAGACVDAIGRPEFEDALLALLRRQTGIEQCMLFAYGHGDRMGCLLAANPRKPALAQRLARRYVGGGFRSDPNYPRLRQLLTRPTDDAAPEAMRTTAMPDAYRDEFFARPALVDKVSLRVPGEGVAYYLNLYRGRGEGAFTGDEVHEISALAPLLASLMRRHYSDGPPTEGAGTAESRLLETLSTRERELCTLLLRGHTLKSAAAAAGMNPGTAETYRRRAYHKLGVHSRAELARRCHPHPPAG